MPLRSLNAPTAVQRLAALSALAPELAVDRDSPYVNNHIHTIYSFSPYSPCAALYMAQQAGLSTAGIMDHDSVAGADEFIKGGEIIGMATTVGVEMRVSMRDTPFSSRRLNNTDQIGCAYVTMHGIPHGSLPMIEDFLSPLRARRNQRNRLMTQKASAILQSSSIPAIDFDADVLPLSRDAEGGSVTERHICAALANAIIAHFGEGEALLHGVTNALQMEIPAKIALLLAQPASQNPHLTYDLIGALKSALVPRFYIDADAECPSLADYLHVARQAGAISAYPYLGDIADSVTGDKRAQAFEDEYLDDLFPYLTQSGFDAVTYMPTRNTPAQLSRIQRLCAQYGLFQISGEDINSPRQSFICPQLLSAEFAHLRTATWALIGHEVAATQSLANGMFTPQTMDAHPSLDERVAIFAAMGKG